MFMCSISTKIFEHNPIWTSGCQSDPDDYSCENTSDTKEDNLTPQDIKDPVLAIFLKAILKKSNVESFEIEADNIVSKWPDEFGGTRTSIKLSGKKNPEHTESLTKREIALDKRHGVPIHIDKKYWQNIIEKFDSLSEISQLSVIIFERSAK